MQAGREAGRQAGRHILRLEILHPDCAPSLTAGRIEYLSFLETFLKAIPGAPQRSVHQPDLAVSNQRMSEESYLWLHQARDKDAILAAMEDAKEGY